MADTIKEAGIEIQLVHAPESKKIRKKEPPSKVCSMCTDNEAKYTCPKCFARSCSLKCVKLHKEQTGCNGKRDRVVYVPLKNMNTTHLISDMRFLEEIEASSGGAKRHLVEVVGEHAHVANRSSLKRPRPTATTTATSTSSFSTSSSSSTITTTTTTKDDDEIDPATEYFHRTKNPLTGGGPMAPPALAQKRSKREKLLSTAARGRNIDLILLSTGMQRRLQNGSHYHKKNDQINWQIEWICGGSSETTVGNDENKTLKVLSEKIRTLNILFDKTVNNDSDVKVTNEREWIYLMVKARCPANDQRFYNLGNGNFQTLREMLSGKSFVEHPIIHIVHSEKVKEYNIFEEVDE